MGARQSNYPADWQWIYFPGMWESLVQSPLEIKVREWFGKWPAALELSLEALI